MSDMVNHPSHYGGDIEVIDYLRDKLTTVGFTEYCGGNVLKYVSRWRKKDGVQDLKKAYVYLGWMIESAEKEAENSLFVTIPETVVHSRDINISLNEEKAIGSV